MKKLLLLPLIIIFLNSCDKTYSDNDKLNFRKNDTIYVEFIGELLPAVVIKNDTTKQILIVRRKNFYDNYLNLNQVNVYKYNDLP